MQDDLIYDVGLSDGSDTAYYLHRGYRVVAVDADASAVEQAEVRFAKEIGAGRLTVLHRLICDDEEERERPFFVCPESPDLNSAHPDWVDKARRQGLAVNAVTARSTNLPSLMRLYGVPHYLKIDIEGYGDDALRALGDGAVELPRYVSNEMSSLDSLLVLWSLGYRRFKLIEQSALLPLPFPPRRESLRQVLSRRPVLRRLARGTVQRLERLRGRRIHTYAPKVSVGDWTFPVRTSSGPFGADLTGEWLTFEQAAAVWCHQWRLANYDHEQLIWIDVHATAAQP